MQKKIIIFILIIYLTFYIFPIKEFYGYSSKNNGNDYTVSSLLNSKHLENNKFNENYFHDAQFPDQGITIFTDLVFSNSFFDKKNCKLNCIVTFKNDKKYVFNKDFESVSKNISSNAFSIKLEKNFVELSNNVYKIHIEDENINLNLDYKIINPPYIFGDGMVKIDSKNFLSFSQPIVGAIVTGNLKYENKNIVLAGRGSLNHDYNIISPVKNPQRWRSFWFYDDKYAIIIHSFILYDNTQVDRVIISKNGNILKSFINCGLESKNFQEDPKTDFNYPTNFTINYTDPDFNSIKANINYKSFTDKFKAFDNLSFLLHKVVSKLIGEMWEYRFWADSTFNLKIDGKEENIKITGIGNYVDMIQ